jgi:hypothetical protein
MKNLETEVETVRFDLTRYWPFRTDRSETT